MDPEMNIKPEGEMPESSVDDESYSTSQTTTLSSGSNLDSIEKKDDVIETSEEKLSEKLKVGRFSTIVNLLNTLLGAGILSVPSTLGNSGIILSVILLVIIALIAYISTTLVFKLQFASGANGFEDIAQQILGKWGCVALGIMNLVFNSSALLAYLVLGGDFIISFFAAGGIDASKSLYRAIIVFVYAIIVPIALSIPRSLKFLSYFSGVVIIVIFYYVIAMMVEIGKKVPQQGISKSIILAKMNLDFFSAISVYCLSFALPIAVLPIVYYYNPSVKKRSFAAAIAMGMVCFLTAFPSVLAYLIYGEECQGNILSTFPDGDILILIARIGFFMVVTFSYPVIHQPVICAWSQLIFHENQAANLKGWRRVVALIITNIIPLLIALFLPEVKPAIEVGGAFGGCLGNFSFPGLMWFVFSNNRWFHWKNIMALLLVIFGVVCAIIATYVGVVGAIKAFKTVKF